MSIDRKLSTEKVTPELINYIVEKIIREIKPEKIVLFGSYARGDFKQDSDRRIQPSDKAKDRCLVAGAKVCGRFIGPKIGGSSLESESPKSILCASHYKKWQGTL